MTTIKKTNKIVKPPKITEIKVINKEITPQIPVNDDKSINKAIPIFTDINELNEYMQHAAHKIAEHQTKVNSKNRQTDDTYKTFDNIMPEFTQSCMIIGYNLLGEKFVYAYLPKERDKDAISEHLKNVFMKTMIMNQQGL